MGYACPVCGDPQADAGHLANHLAFTAILGESAHEAWLDDHAAGWGQMGESELAAAVVDHVEETEFPQLFDDTVGGLEEPADSLAERSGALFEEEGHGHDQDHDHGSGGRQQYDRVAARSGLDPSDAMDAETAAILEEAREMTREMYGDGDAEGVESDDGDARGVESDDEAAPRDAETGSDGSDGPVVDDGAKNQ